MSDYERVIRGTEHFTNFTFHQSAEYHLMYADFSPALTRLPCAVILRDWL